jgi:hypothetical protein
MVNKNIYKSIISYLTGITFLYISILLSHYVKYNGHFLSALPLILPIVFALVLFGVSVLFIFGRSYPWFFRTGMMSLTGGLTVFIFGIISFMFNINAVIGTGSVGIGILFILAAIVRLIIQRGLSAYKNSKN